MDKHDFTINLEYVQLPSKPDGNKTAVLAIRPKYRKGNRYLFDLDNAWMIREDSQMVACAMEICNVLYDVASPQRAAQIAMALENYIDDLVMAKPAPEGEKEIVGEGKMLVNGSNHYFPLTKEKQ